MKPAENLLYSGISSIYNACGVILEQNLVFPYRFHEWILKQTHQLSTFCSEGPGYMNESEREDEEETE